MIKTNKPLSLSERARKGGLSAAKNMTPEQRRERARKGGLAKSAEWKRLKKLDL